MEGQYRGINPLLHSIATQVDLKSSITTFVIAAFQRFLAGQSLNRFGKPLLFAFSVGVEHASDIAN